MERKINRKTIKLRTALVFCVTFVVAVIFVSILTQNQIKEEKLKAAYTAESTVTNSGLK